MKKRKNFYQIALVFALLVGSFSSFAQELSKGKYGPQATRLYLDRSYIRQHKAPDYWALSPYYLAQKDSKSCSLAAFSMVLNAMRAKLSLSASDQLITQTSILKKVNHEAWNRFFVDGGKSVTLDEFGNIAEAALKTFGISGYKVEVVHVNKADKAERIQIKKILAQNEKNDHSFVIANFLQSEFTGDPEGAVGHVAPVAAYEAKKDRVLIMDPDREWYEPYWVSIETFLKGMNTLDKDAGKNRGLIWIHQ